MFLQSLVFCVSLLNFEQALSESEGVKGPVIGIDLGTTYSCVGIFRGGKVDIIQNDQGNRITPSYVAFTKDGERLVGDPAKGQLTVNPENTIFDVKRLIGRRFDEKSVQDDMKLWPFKVVNQNGRPYIEVDVGGERKRFAPEEISAMVLSKMKDFAQDYLKVNITNAVITVPAYFNDPQRQSTKDAGAIAGLNVLRVINEPTAAAIAFGIDNKQQEMNIFVYDLGGGTFDVSALSFDNGVFEVAATKGDTHLGGEDFDNRLMHHFIKSIESAGRKFDKNDLKSIQKLRREVEKLKRALSQLHEATLELELPDGDFSATITRSKFEQINADLFKKTLELSRECIKDSKLSIEDFHQIVLVGGSTRIPRIQALVSEFFNDKELNRGVNPDEAVAIGAAIQGAIMSGQQETADIVLIDVCPLSLGIAVQNGLIEVIIARNSKIPTKQTKSFTTVMDNQETVRIEIYQGERSMARDNYKLGQFDLVGIPRAPRGQPQIEVTFAVDNNGILQVDAVEKSSGKSNKITITNEQRQLRSDEINRMIEDAQKFADEDKKSAEKAKAKSDFESHLYSIRNQLKDESGMGGKIAEEDKKALNSAVDDSIAWLDNNPSASVEEINSQRSEFEKQTLPILGKYGGGQGQAGDFTPPSGEQASEEESHEEL
ncbi:78 kDa glucose-regulated protein [Thelohanellus kitauei]|uniref:78 kDa glucose-regulated protein n=1 Tax=Thelohanellus kitauei TaxID=669202 RepID=A0A0C2IBT6_THEKT|nr:78 kDa glucose-regulated protein [Thelohanellus kitauei]